MELFLVHCRDNSCDEVIHEAERTSLLTLSVHGDVFSLESLHDKIRYYSAIVKEHAWAIGVKDADYTGFNVPLLKVVDR